MKINNNNKLKKKFSMLGSILPTLGIALASCAPSASGILEKNQQTSLFRGQNIPIYPQAFNDENIYKNPRIIQPAQFNNNFHKMDFQISPVNNIVTNPTTFPASFLVAKYPPVTNNSFKFDYWATVAELTNDQLKSDIYNSLVNLADNVKLSVDFSSLKIEINKKQTDIQDAEIDHLLVEFTISNISNENYLLYDAINLAAFSNTTVKISLKGSSIDLIPWYVQNNDVREKALAAAWKLGNVNPEKVNKIQVNLTHNINFNNSIPLTANLELPELQILSSQSYALNTLFKSSGNLPSYNEIQPFALSQLQKLSDEDLKNDLNDWFLVYWKQKMLSSWNDILTTFNFLTTSSVVLANGKKINLLTQLIEDNAQRDILLKSMGVSDSIRKLISSILTPRKDYDPPTYAQVYVIFQALTELNLSDWITENIQPEINWIEFPKINWENPSSPKISFQFDYKINFLADLSIPLVGEGKFENNDVSWKITDYIVIKNMIAAFTGSDKIGGGDFVSNAINQIQSYINWTSLDLKMGDSISWEYAAVNSPFQFYIAPSFDQNQIKNATFGWQVSDVQTTYDFSNLKSFWRTFYQPLVDVDGSKFNILSDTDKVKKGDFKALIEFLNYLFKTPNSSAVQTLFETIVNQKYTIESMPMYVNLSRAFYHLPQSFDEEPLWTKVTDLKPETHPKYLESNVTNLKLNLNLLFNKQNNTNQTNFTYKDLKIQEEALNYSFTYFANDYSLIPNFNEENVITNVFAKYKTDSEFKKHVVNEVNQIIEKSNYKSSLKSNLIPKVSLVQVPLKQAIDNAFQAPFSRGFNSFVRGFLVSLFAPNLAREIRLVPGGLVQRDAYVLIINTQLPGAYATLDEKNDIRLNDSNSYQYYFVSPIFDMTKIKIPKTGR